MKSARSLEFDPTAFEDLASWIEQDRKKALKIVKLIEAIQRDRFRAPGNPSR
jgi:toxin YoeB